MTSNSLNVNMTVLRNALNDLNIITLFDLQKLANFTTLA